MLKLSASNFISNKGIIPCTLYSILSPVRSNILQATITYKTLSIYFLLIANNCEKIHAILFVLYLLISKYTLLHAITDVFLHVQYFLKAFIPPGKFLPIVYYIPSCITKKILEKNAFLPCFCVCLAMHFHVRS